MYSIINISFKQELNTTLTIKEILTENSQVGFGCSDRHGEERAGVHAFIRQRDVTDADGQLGPRRAHQLNPVVP